LGQKQRKKMGAQENQKNGGAVEKRFEQPGKKVTTKGNDRGDGYKKGRETFPSSFREKKRFPGKVSEKGGNSSENASGKNRLVPRLRPRMSTLITGGGVQEDTDTVEYQAELKKKKGTLGFAITNVKKEGKKIPPYLERGGGSKKKRRK